MPGRGLQIPVGSLENEEKKVHPVGGGLTEYKPHFLLTTSPWAAPLGAAASVNVLLDAKREVEQLQQLLSYSLGWL